MGKNPIERGSRDNWTIHPKVLADVQAAIAKDAPPPTEGAGRRGGDGAAGDAGDTGGGGGRQRGVSMKYYEILRNPVKRDPRAYVIPSDQPDFLTATKFVNALIKNGVAIERATAAFQAGGKSYPAGLYVIKTAQAFRPHVLDMFESQDHPDDIPYPGGPPTPPYDSAGCTLAYQMGVVFDRFLDPVDGPFEKVNGLAPVTRGTVKNSSGAAGFILSHQVNDSFIAMNRLLGSSEDVYWLKLPFTLNGKDYGPGTIYVPKEAPTLPKLQKLAEEVGLNFEGIPMKPVWRGVEA